MVYNPIQKHNFRTDGAAIAYLERKAQKRQFKRDLLIFGAWPIVCLALAFSVLFIV
jgi:hypothetical protein